MIPDRIIDHIRGWITENERDIRYQRSRLEKLVSELASIQSEIVVFERLNKENQAAIAKLMEES